MNLASNSHFHLSCLLITMISSHSPPTIRHHFLLIIRCLFHNLFSHLFLFTFHSYRICYVRTESALLSCLYRGSLMSKLQSARTIDELDLDDLLLYIYIYMRRARRATREIIKWVHATSLVIKSSVDWT